MNTNIFMDVVTNPISRLSFNGTAGMLTAVAVVVVVAAAVAIIIRTVNKKNRDNKGE